MDVKLVIATVLLMASFCGSDEDENNRFDCYDCIISSIVDRACPIPLFSTTCDSNLCFNLTIWVIDKDTTPPINVTVIEFGCVTDDIQLSGADELCYPKTETLTSSFYMRCVCSSNKCNNPSNILIYDKVSAESQKTKLSTGVSLVPSGASVLFGVAGMSSYVALGHLFSTP